MKRFLAVLVSFFVSSILLAQEADFPNKHITSNGDGGSVILDPKDTKGVAKPILTVDPRGYVKLVGSLRPAAGSASAPAYTFVTDATSGLYSGGSGVLKLSTASTERVMINSTGTKLAGALTVGGNATTDGAAWTPAGTVSAVTNSAYYEGTFAAAFTGAASVSATVKFVKTGKLVTLQIPGSGDQSCAAAVFTAATVVPSALRPAANIDSGVAAIKNNGAAVTAPGNVTVGSNGTIVISKDFAGGSFTDSATCAWSSTTLTYTTL